MSNKALKSIRQSVRRRAFHRHSEWSLEGLAETINPSMRRWINYYGWFNRSVLGPV
ncbi:MAG TPA: group II intron maturase-specific domain-containing protein [Rhizomicrobium sp.]|nr:group II intron maturase-specific domain-containing protein [Rhizomicrobium sp.]